MPLLLLVALSLRKVDGLDAGFHLRVGNSILDGDGWPRTDAFAFTLKGRAYVDTSWGFQVLLAATERLAGSTGMILLMTLLEAATFVLLLATARLGRAPPAAVAALLTAGVLTCELRFSVRPEWLSYALFAALLLILHRRALGRAAPLWLLPLLFLVWVNAHSLFVLGLVALVCCIAGTAVERGELDRPLTWWSLAAGAACLVNPYGLDALLHSFSLLTRFHADNVFHRVIGEFRSPLAAGAEPLRMLPLLAFRIFAALAFVGTLVLVRRSRWWCALLVAATAAPALGMVRNMPVFVVAAFAPAAWGIGAWERLRRPRVERAVIASTTALALVVALRVRTDAYYVDMRRQTRSGFGLNEIALPVEAAQYVRSAGIDGRMLNHLNFGGYLMWALGEPVYLDGRLEVLGEDRFEELDRAFTSAEARAAQAAKHDLRWAIVPTGTSAEVVRSFSSDGAWALSHVDPVAAVFVRADLGADLGSGAADRTPAPLPLRLDEVPGLPGGPARLGRLEAWLADLAARRTPAPGNRDLALFHRARGEHEHAAAYLAEAVRRDGGREPLLYADLGRALAELGRRELADACLRIALGGER